MVQYLAAFFAHDTNAHISRLDHGHIISPITNAKHLATQPPLLPLHVTLKPL